jgi:transposase-like protein
VAGVDYPRTFQEFDAWFGSETACREYIRRLRWPDGFVCPHCAAVGEPWEMSRSLLRCRACDRQVSLTAGTVLQDTRKPLRMWFLAMWFVTSQKNGVSALGLQRVLGLGSYETAWTWLHKLRRAMVRPGRDCLAGEIEIDETYVGGPEEGKRGRQTEDKAIVVVAAEKSGRGIGRIRLRHVADGSADSLSPFVQAVAVPGSTIHTDGWSGYARLPTLGYQHQVTVISGGFDPAHVVMPRVHNVASLLKRWLMGTHQGGIQDQHLDYYLDEFTFRFNRRRSQARGLLFHRLAQQAVAVGPAPYHQIIATSDPARHWGLREWRGYPLAKVSARWRAWGRGTAPYVGAGEACKSRRSDQREEAQCNDGSTGLRPPPPWRCCWGWP